MNKNISLSDISQALNGFRNVKLWLFHAAAYVRFLIRIETFALGQNLAADFDLKRGVKYFLKYYSYAYPLVLFTRYFFNIQAILFNNEGFCELKVELFFKDNFNPWRSPFHHVISNRKRTKCLGFFFSCCYKKLNSLR